MKKITVRLLFLLLLPALYAQSADPLYPAALPPDITTPSAVLLDAETGTLLFSRNPSLVISPASLTKLMTIHLALREIKAGRASADDLVDLPPESWAENQPPRSSLMFLGRGQRVTLGELLLGLAVPSGNDAAVAAALHLAPTMEAFVDMMNAEAGRLELASTRFAEPAGISPGNTTTAGDFALFCRTYLLEHPDSIGLLHSVPSFAYPTAANIDQPRTILQYNHNTLLGKIAGVNGLKTGHITEAGYNIALSARRETTCLIAVLLGAATVEERDRDGEILLAWGFDNFKTLYLNARAVPQARIWGGKEKYAALKPGESLTFTVSARRAGVLQQDTEIARDLRAPLRAGAEAGQLIISDSMGELRRIPLVLEKEAPRGNFLRVLLDSIAFFFKRLFGK
ncbi:MAG: D-alanyl-D-alanine carboxypeptidase [Spirochaetaceae bacterium]|jgi:D-alanyl-D-alanine carboxypeptidase (penicillin-binding protein 5/6)|nr:D-alanyl-D-alanine carboxypeptidase [Spirochaetaceae bacterium]